MGIWQVSRANEKKALLKAYAQRTKLIPMKATAILQPGDWRFYRAELTGIFDNAHTLLLDNKTHEGKIGYEVYTPFISTHLSTPILVDRGFIPMGNTRKVLPVIPAIKGTLTLTGMLNAPPAYVSLGTLTDTPANTWPMRIEYVNLKELSSLFKQALFPYVLHITPTDPVLMKPEKHMGYAVQWFAFALTLLILFVALNRPKKKSGQ